MIDFFQKFEFLIVPFLTWFGVQLFKLIYDRIETKKWHMDRFWGSGGMPSSHTATVVSLCTLVAKKTGIESMQFAIACIFAFIVMCDAAGVRKVVGEHSKLLNDMLKNKKLTGAQKFQELTGHTTVQVIVGALVGFTVGMIL